MWQLDKDIKPAFKKLCEIATLDVFILSRLWPKYKDAELEKIKETIDDMF